MQIRKAMSRALGIQRDPSTRSIAWINPATLQLNLPSSSSSVVRLAPETALGLATLNQGINMIADTVASLPRYAWRDLERVDPQPSIVRRPDPFNHVTVWRRQITTSLLLYGNAFAWLTAHDRSGRPTVAIPIPTAEVQISWNDQRTRPVYRWRGRELELDVEIMHIKATDITGSLYGIGAIQAVAETIGAGLEGEKLAGEFYSNGALPDGVVSVPSKLSQDEADRIRAGYNDRHAGKRGVAFLTGGMTFQATSIKASDMQFLEGRRFTAEEANRILRIPAALQNLQSGSGSLTYRNERSIYLEYVRLAIEPWTERLDAALELLLPSTIDVRTDFDRLLRSDPQTRWNTYALARQNEILTTNEIRILEGLDPLPDGDALDFNPEKTKATPDATTQGATV